MSSYFSCKIICSRASHTKNIKAQNEPCGQYSSQKRCLNFVIRLIIIMIFDKSKRHNMKIFFRREDFVSDYGNVVQVVCFLVI